MKLSAQQAGISARNISTMIAKGGRVSPLNIGQDWSEYINVWDCRNAVLHNSNYRHHILTTLNTHHKPKGAWLPVEREMTAVAMAFFDWKRAESRLEELQSEASEAHPEGVLRVAYKVDRLREVYEAAEAACDLSKEAIGWEYFCTPSMEYAWMQ